MPINYLIIEALQRFHYYYGDDFKVECPTGSGHFLTLYEVAEELSRRLSSLFLKGADGERPVLKYHPKLATDPHFRDYVLFHEYFHGDTGRGAGASHQTGWTGLVAKLLQPHTTERSTLRDSDHRRGTVGRQQAPNVGALIGRGFAASALAGGPPPIDLTVGVPCYFAGGSGLLGATLVRTTCSYPSRVVAAGARPTALRR